jgi:methyl-accepting chemotaxis protein
VTQHHIRHPYGNFLIKKELQFHIISRIFLVLLLSAAFASCALTLVYYFKSQNGTFFYMSNNLAEPAIPENFLQVVLPTFLLAEVLSIIIGLGIGLFFSRQVAIPVYKFQKWVEQLTLGNLNARISFREREHMQDVTSDCNTMAEKYHDIIARIKTKVIILENCGEMSEEGKLAVRELGNELKKFTDNTNINATLNTK